jgi:ribosomal protein S18 acetylase RimI-like enzyme
MRYELVPFADRFLDEAALLLARRHERDRAALPLLPARFEEPEAARVAVEAAWRGASASGVAATHRGRLAGYLIGHAASEPVRGRCAWVRLPGHALAEEVDAELYRDLYAALAARWVAQGFFDHYALVPAGDRAGLDAWAALSFGQEHAHGLRSLEDQGPTLLEDASHLPSGLEIRRATPDDRAALVEVSQWLRRYQAGPPIWGAALPEDAPEIEQGYAEMAGDETATVWLAFLGGRVAGFQAYFPAGTSDTDLLTPPGCAELKVAATHPDARGRGIGPALTRRGLAHAAVQGYTVCVVDWRVTNLLSSRFWPHQGFRPAVCRLVRRVDPRIVWAQG